MPVNETTIASSGTQLVAGANDYNSYNNQGQDGYFWSSDGGVTWSDAGPIDIFPQDPNNGAGDPGVAIDGNGLVYYSSIFFNFNNCSVGGVELLRRDPNTGSWSYYQIANNSASQFQDKPAIALDSANHHVLVSWTQFGSCSGVNVTSPIRVAIFADGATSVAPTTTLTNVPGSTYSQGSSLAPDGSGGFWLTWEEYPGNGSRGEIRLAHYTGSGWATFSNNANQGWEKISPTGFTDLPNPLPGFAFRTNSLPALTVVGNSPLVVWTSYDSRVGRAYLWSGGPGVTAVSNTGGDQFFPAIAPDNAGGVYVTYSQVTDAGAGTYDQWLADANSGGVGSSIKVSTASSYPNTDFAFGGAFIGDYSGMTAPGGSPHPMWTDLRTDLAFFGKEMDTMAYAGPSPPPPTTTTTTTSTTTTTVPTTTTTTTLPTTTTTTTVPTTTTTTTSTTTLPQPNFTLSVSPASQSVPVGGGISYTVTITRLGGFSGSVTLSVSGLPNRATDSFSPNPIPSDGTSSTMSVTTNSRTHVGTYSLKVTGKNGSLSHSYQVNLVVQA